MRNPKHIYFNNDTKLIKDNNGTGVKIPPQSFDLFTLEDVDKMKKDNRFLIGKNSFHHIQKYSVYYIFIEVHSC